jgi:hypothetical protein
MEITRSVQLTFINYYLLEILQFIKHRHGFMYSTSLVISYLWKKWMSSELNILFSKAMTFCMLHVLVVVVRGVLLCIFLWCFSLILELFRQCAIFGTVRTVCYFWNCSDSVLFLELFRQCAIFGTKSSDRKCLVNIRDILKRYF